MIQRLRRLRKNSAIRELVSETRLHVSNLIQPFFIIPGKNKIQPISSMPGINQLTIEPLLKNIENFIHLGGRTCMLFATSDRKDKTGKFAYNDKNGIILALKAIKKEFPHLLVITDVCLCSYLDHGHCGVLDHGIVSNDKTLPILSKIAVAYAQAGADIIAPSDMMDFRVKAIREGLDKENFEDISILSYAVKYSSAYYGPFRDATQNSPTQGDRRSYQMDCANSREALREAKQDIHEGTDMIIVKPALAYLDIIHLLRNNVDVPLVAYNVSGEYSLVKAGASKGWIDEKAVVLENLLSMKRAGADSIITYHATDALGWLQ